LGLVPGGGIYPRHSQGHRENNTNKATCDIDARLRLGFRLCTKTTLGLPVIWGDFGTGFTKKS
jgi:hypothetical protein